MNSFRRFSSSVMFLLAKIIHDLGLSSVPFLRKIGYELFYLLNYPEDLSLVRIFNSLLYFYTNSPIGQNLICGKLWEPGVTYLIQNILKRGNIFVDIGANVGYYTILAADLVGQEGCVVAFEPEPRNYEILCRNLRINRLTNVICENLAVSNKCGLEKLYLAPLDPGAHSFFFRGLDHYIVVRTTSLDAYFSSGKLSVPDLVKIDAEGAELQILKGMVHLINGSKGMKIIMEFNPEFLRSIGIKPEDLLNLIKLLKLNLNIIEDNGSLTPSNSLMLFKRQEPLNLFCYK